MSKKNRLPRIDGLGPREKRRIRIVLRQVWQYSFARKLVIDRCTDKDGFPKCEQCLKRVPKVTVDHIYPCGEVDAGFITRLFVSSKQMRGLCKKCHQKKTNAERKERERSKDFY